MSRSAEVAPASMRTGNRPDGKAASPVLLIMRAVLLENLRRRDFYVVLILMGMFLVGALIARLAGIQNEATAVLLLNLGLTVAVLSAHALTLLAAARQIPNELDLRTIYPLLAKPMSRNQLLIGKWAAVWLSGVLALLALLPLAMLPIRAVSGTSAVLFAEALFLQITSLGLLAALATLGSLLMPRALNIVTVALLYGAGGAFVNFLRARFAGSGTEGVVRWMTGYIPDFSRLDLMLAYTSGGSSVGAGDLALRTFHGAACTIFALALAGWFFNRRAL